MRLSGAISSVAKRPASQQWMIRRPNRGRPRALVQRALENRRPHAAKKGYRPPANDKASLGSSLSRACGPDRVTAKRRPRRWTSWLPRQGQKSLCTVEFARNANRKERWRSTAKSPAWPRQAPRRSPTRPHAFALEASSPCRPRLCTASQRTRLPMRRLRRSTPPRSGQRSTRSSPTSWTSRRRESTPSLARRPRCWPARSGRGLSLWSCLRLRPAASACWRARASTLSRYARRRTKRLALLSGRLASPSRRPRPTDPVP